MLPNLSATKPGGNQKQIIRGLILFGALITVLGCISPADVVKPSGPQQPAGVAEVTNAPKATRTAAPTQTEGPPTETPTSTPTQTTIPRPTFTPLPTHTPLPPTRTPLPVAEIVSTEEPSPTDSPAAGPTDFICFYDSAFVEDLSIPDDTNMLPNTSFTKSWRLTNTGCHGWSTDVDLVFVSGTQFSGAKRTAVERTPTEQNRKIDIDLIAPKKSGSYTGYWRLQDPDKHWFGTTVHVTIKVVSKLVAFDATYSGPWTCKYSGDTQYKYAVAITNTSTLTFQSLEWSLMSGKYVVNSALNNTPFQSVQSAGKCNASSVAGSSLGPGGSAWVSGYADSPLTTGKISHLVLNICTGDNLTGTCTTKTVDFTP